MHSRGESSTTVDNCDLVFTTHQVQLKRSEWTRIKKTLKYRKAESYVFCYDRERCSQYFHKSCSKWEKSNDSRKEYAIEIMQDATLFYVLSRRIFQSVYLSIDEFLQDNLEEGFLQDEYLPFRCVNMNDTYFPYREKKQAMYHAECGFNDINLEKKKKLLLEERSRREWIMEHDVFGIREREWMSVKNLYQITDSRTDDAGCLSEDAVYMNDLEYKTAELREYDNEGNPIRRTAWYEYPDRGAEQREESEYFYRDGRREEAVFRCEEWERKGRKPYFREPEQVSWKVIKRTYFYDEDGSLQRTEDEIEEYIKGNIHSYQEYSLYEKHTENTGSRGGMSLSEITAVRETFRKSEKDGRDSLLYQCTDLDFCEYGYVKRKVRTELFYREGSRKHPKKTVTTFIYDFHGKKILKEIREDFALLHDYREIDERHSICVTYRVRKEDVIDSDDL